MKVRATQTGFYQHARRREGDVFTLVPIETVERDDRGQVKTDKTGKPIPKTLSPTDQFSHKWMEEVSEKTKEKVSTAQETVNKKHDEIVGDRTPPRNKPQSFAESSLWPPRQ